MASNWIKVEVITPDKPEIFQLAEILNIDPDTVLGKLIRVWVWADQQIIDGNADGNAVSVTKTALDRITFMPGFADALIAIGWLKNDGDKMHFPNFERHNGKGSKKRALTNDRVTNLRQSKRDGNKKGNASGVTPPLQEALPEEEEEEEEDKTKDPPIPPLGVEGKIFDSLSLKIPDWLSFECWQRWVNFRVELGKPIKTKSAATACIKRLDEFRQQGYAPESVISNTIANDWKSLSPPQKVFSANAGIDFEGSYDRIISCKKKPINRSEEIAKKMYGAAGLRMASDFDSRRAWRGFLKQAYNETGEQPNQGA